MGGLVLGCAVGVVTAGTAASPGPRVPDPVIFVHGCPPGPPLCVSGSGGACTNEQGNAFWRAMVDEFRSHGYPDSRLHVFLATGPSCDSTLTQSAELARLVGRVRASTGAPKVDIVAHSMGALTTRLYLRQSHLHVDDFVSIGGANHGSVVASAGVAWQAQFGAPAYEGAKQMFPPYACRGQTSGGAADVQLQLNGCLTAAGRTLSRDETPGNVDYLSIRNAVDEMVSPRESSCLNQRFQNDCSDTRVNVEVSVPPGPGPCGPTGCPGHVTMVWDPSVIRATYRFMACEGDDDCGAARGK
jgi:pimeloyl-ACP methyl ester carboxylesterase